MAATAAIAPTALAAASGPKLSDLDRLRSAIAELEATGPAPARLIMHPDSWEKMHSIGFHIMDWEETDQGEVIVLRGREIRSFDPAYDEPARIAGLYVDVDRTPL